MKGYIFDLDGTVYLGDRMIPGAAEAIRALRERGDKVLFLSNKPIATRMSYVRKLNKMNIPARLEDVLNSSAIVAAYLKERVKNGERVYVVGEKPISDELARHGITPIGDDGKADYVVLSWDRKFTYDKLNRLYRYAIGGAFVIASNPDCTCPLEDGQIPDTGAMIAALEAATGRPIDLVAGKPSRIAADAAVRCLGLDYGDCYMVGDRLDTDIRMANETGMKSVLVLTGVSTARMAERSEYRPSLIIESIRDIAGIS